MPALRLQRARRPIIPNRLLRLPNRRGALKPHPKIYRLPVRNPALHAARMVRLHLQLLRAPRSS